MAGKLGSSLKSMGKQINKKVPTTSSKTKTTSLGKSTARKSK